MKVAAPPLEVRGFELVVVSVPVAAVLQLESVAADFLMHDQMIKVDRDAGVVSVTPILSWREAEFVAAFDTGSTGAFAQRSPIERAIIAFVQPRLLPLERDFIQQNGFRMVFHPFDWRLNDLTGGRVD